VRAAADPEQAGIQSAAAGVDLQLLNRYRARVTHTHKRINAVVIEVDEARAADLERALTRKGYRVEASVAVRPLLNQSVPQMSVDAVWKLSFSGAGVRIGVADTGVDATHTDFRGPHCGL